MRVDMEFSLDKSGTSATQSLEVSNRNDTILIGTATNPNMLALTFYADCIKLDIDNTNGEFDSLEAIANHKVGKSLQFDAKSVQINPDLTINLNMTNTGFKTLRIRPDEITRQGSNGSIAPVLTFPELLNISLPKNIFKHKAKIEGLDAFPTQLNEIFEDFDNAKIYSYDIGDNKTFIAKANDNYYVSDGDFLRECNTDMIYFNKKKDDNSIKFSFADTDKVLKNVPDNTLNEIAELFNKSTTEPSSLITEEQINNTPALLPITPHKYIKSEKTLDGEIARFEDEKQTKIYKQKEAEIKENKDSKSPAPESKIKTESFDLSYPLKLIGFLVFMIGFFGGPLFTMILGTCICGSGYVFSSKIEEIKLPVGEKNPKKRYIKQKQPKKEPELSKENLVENRLEKLINLKIKLTNRLESFKTVYAQQQEIYNRMREQYNNLDEKQKQSANNLLTTFANNLHNMNKIIQNYENNNSNYQTLIQSSIDNLQTTINSINLDKTEISNNYETSYDKMLQANQVLSNLQKQHKNLESKFQASSPEERATITQSLNELEAQIKAQKNTYGLYFTQTQQLKQLIENIDKCEKLYADNMDGGVTYQNINNGEYVLEDADNKFRELENINIQFINSNSQNFGLDLTID